MLSTKALATSTVFVSYQDKIIATAKVRNTILKNIYYQTEIGFNYELKEDKHYTLDHLFNSRLEPEFRAPTVKQIKLISVIANKLDLDPHQGVFSNKGRGEEFIAKYYPSLQLMMEEDENGT